MSSNGCDGEMTVGEESNLLCEGEGVDERGPTTSVGKPTSDKEGFGLWEVFDGRIGGYDFPRENFVLIPLLLVTLLTSERPLWLIPSSRRGEVFQVTCNT